MSSEFTRVINITVDVAIFEKLVYCYADDALLSSSGGKIATKRTLENL